MISSRSFFTRILAALAVLISVCYGGARLASGQYSPAGGNTFGGMTGISGGAVANGPGNAVTTLYLGDANYLDGQLPVGFQQAQVLGGSLGGTTASGTVLQGDGTGTNTLSDGGSNFSILSTGTQFASGTSSVVYSARGRVNTTDGTTAVTCCYYTPAANELDRWTISITARDAQGDSGTEKYGSFGTGDMSFTSNRLQGAAPTLSPASPIQYNIGGAGFSDGSVWNVTLAAAVSSNTVNVNVTGVTGYNPIAVTCSCEVQAVQ